MSKFFQYLDALSSQEAVLITSQVNRRYVTDFPSSDGIVFAADGQAHLFVDMRYYELALIAQKRGQIPKRFTVEHYKDHQKVIEAHLNQGVKTVYFEDRRTVCSRLEALKQTYPTAEFLPLGDSIEAMRAVKTPEELSRIKKAQELTTAAYLHVLNFIRKGVTEWEVALELDFYMRKQGAQSPAFETICVSGSRSSLPHGRPEHLPLTENSFITMDFGARVDGYCSDMTRTVVLGKADEEQKRIYQTVLEAQLAALAAAKGGVMGCEVDRAARDLITKAGYGEYFSHSTGHSIGLEVHENPNFSSRWEKPIPAGAVVSVEPGIYLEGRYGVRIEDMVFLTENGCENLTPVAKELLELS